MVSSLKNSAAHSLQEKVSPVKSARALKAVSENGLSVWEIGYIVTVQDRLS